MQLTAEKFGTPVAPENPAEQVNNVIHLGPARVKVIKNTREIFGKILQKTKKLFLEPKRDPRSVENLYQGQLEYIEATKGDWENNHGHIRDRLSWFLMANHLSPYPIIAKKIWQIIMPIEPKLFGMLRDPKTRLDDFKAYLSSKYHIAVNSFEDFYNRLDEIMKVIVPDKARVATSKSGEF